MSPGANESYFEPMALDAGATSLLADELRIVPIGEFVAVDEPGAAALLGADSESALIPEGGDVMLYGDGGAGKTTLALDLAFHLAAGDKWLDIPVGRPVNTLVIENEGPRPHFRKKLRRKRETWKGSRIGDRIRVLAEPWATFTLANELHREAIAAIIQTYDIEVVVIGPVTAAGMVEAGTIAQVREFNALVSDVRSRSARVVTFILVHHENKGGQVSGAWEGVNDTLIHVRAQGHGRTRIFIQKARWSSSHHGTGFQLAWTEGEGFEVAEGERGDDTIADEILEHVLQNGGTPWTRVEEGISGKGERLRTIRDRLLADGRLVNVGTEQRTKLWHTGDPSRPGWDDSGTASPPTPGSIACESSRPSSPLKGDEDGATHSFYPAGSPGGRLLIGDPGYVLRLDQIVGKGHVAESEHVDLMRLDALVARSRKAQTA